MENFQVSLTEYAAQQVLGLTVRTFEKVKGTIDLLSTSPEIGRLYDPTYESARLPFDFYHKPVPGTSLSVYYIIDIAERSVKVFALIDNRRNPLYKFNDVDPDEAS